MRKVFLFLLVLLSLSSSIWCAEFETIEDLNGHDIGVQTAVLYEDLIRDRVPDTTFQYYTMPNDMILALQSGKVDAYLIEEVSYGVQKKNHPDLAVLDEPAGYINATCIIGNNEKQDRLLSDLNAFIAESRENGLLDELYDYWITDFDPINDTCDVSGFTGENGVISVAIEGGYEPFSFISNGQESGFDVDFICRFARAYGYTPEFYEVPFEAIAPGVETGKYDIGMNIVVSAERNETGTLSDVYYSTPIRLVVQGEDESNATFFDKLQDSFYKTFIRESRWELFVQGAGITILITLTSIIAGTLLGFLVYIVCRKGGKIANSVTNFFLWLIHGMPTVLLLMILYYIVFGSSRLSGTWVSVVGFSLMFACSMIDMLRVGCNAIGRGQFEASRALGYSESQSFFKIILPQAAQHFLPIYRNEVVTLIKETSVVGYIAVLDLTKISDLVRSRTYEAFFPLIVTAIMYFVISALMTKVVTLVEHAIDPKRRKKEKILRGIKEEE
ncbi:MAG: transporter substrate-binding domain-containing protein [Spirochaetes bacterium]|uniref:Transporter substrate-binding domain-containing protein n=1 Tax=Candidatus Ornithospirochaeta stercoripullorum TaxID=2840899 RepID=A0A9D9E1V4_9SPIO|nr:transporter substrate-binding domain-containing protein [Candidatus Ornithospirochaeta stercoripullorum]